MPGKLGSWHLLPVEVIERELREYNARGNRPSMPAWSTWPSRANGKHKKKREYGPLVKIVIRALRRDRWQKLKAELGQEYLERLHERCIKIPENPELVG